MPSFLKMFSLFITFALLVGQNPALAAEQLPPRYISDILVINLKDQIEPPFKVVTRLVSDDRLIILQEKGDFIQVKTDNNIIGWLAKRYTTEKVPKKILIEQLQQKIRSLESEAPEKAQTLADAQEREDLINQQRTVISTLKEHISQLKESVVAEDSYKEKYLELQKKYLDLEKTSDILASGAQAEELITLQNENDKLQNRQYIYFLLTGAFILAFGMFLGKTPDKRRQKRLFF